VAGILGPGPVFFGGGRWSGGGFGRCRFCVLLARIFEKLRKIKDLGSISLIFCPIPF